jgi:hypothetical protein
MAYWLAGSESEGGRKVYLNNYLSEIPLAVKLVYIRNFISYTRTFFLQYLVLKFL